MVRITYIGHATLLIEMDGFRLLTDPILRNRLLHLYRFSDRIDSALYRDIDAVLISHLHWDHLDVASLRRLIPPFKLIVPHRSARYLTRKGFPQALELSPGEEISLGPLTIQATLADHSGSRPPFGPRAESIGFKIKGSQRIYFAGDTDLFPEMSAIAGNLDIALLPIWGWGPNLGPGHMDPHRAAQALRLLQPNIAIPIHWGTFAPLGISLLMRGFLSQPPITFAHHAEQLAPEVQIEIIPPGSSISLHEVNGW